MTFLRSVRLNESDPPVFWCRCELCGREFRSEDPDAWLCPKHAAEEQGSLDAACRAVESPEPPPAKWSRAWNRERLGVNRNVDE